MKKKKVKKSKKEVMKSCCGNSSGSCGGAIYGLGFIGSAIYFISTATGFWMGVLGILKSIVWPAFLVFDIMKLLGM